MKLELEDINRREIYRYLGYRGQEPDDAVQALITEVLNELLEVIRLANSYRYYECEVNNEQGEILLWDSVQGRETAVFFKSMNLAANLSQCKEVVLLAATLGINVDKQIQRYTVLNMAKASIAQACGAACIEAYCNKVQEDIGKEAAARELYLRPRFSPGYGDLALEHQKDIFDLLECHKRLGMSLTDSMLMLPTKSVTAIIGLTPNAQSCHIAKCSTCKKLDCEFREID